MYSSHSDSWAPGNSLPTCHVHLAICKHPWSTMPLKQTTNTIHATFSFCMTMLLLLLGDTIMYASKNLSVFIPHPSSLLLFTMQKHIPISSISRRNEGHTERNREDGVRDEQEHEEIPCDTGLTAQAANTSGVQSYARVRRCTACKCVAIEIVLPREITTYSHNSFNRVWLRHFKLPSWMDHTMAKDVKAGLAISFHSCNQ